ncbi:hypothetical protein AK95_21180 [Paenibacillus sp. LC231]|uniref:hypothetical protein n=1 Tax=Paenibacillus sp. LC231 TaxID=1120679 RepID=UPI0008DDD99C|nr:hypothetical protein [Paenibacillus sp. LC231]OIA99677.1 hypothetical protein AK95_21180 [Paenibacillus sp. LC231]
MGKMRGKSIFVVLMIFLMSSFASLVHANDGPITLSTQSEITELEALFDRAKNGITDRSVSTPNGEAVPSSWKPIYVSSLVYRFFGADLKCTIYDGIGSSWSFNFEHKL